MMSVQSEIEIRRQRIEQLEIELRQERTALRLAQEAAAEFKVGDIVEGYRRVKVPGSARKTSYRYGSATRWDYTYEWQPAIVRAVKPSKWSDHVSYEISYRRKNGTWADKVDKYDKIRKPEIEPVLA